MFKESYCFSIAKKRTRQVTDRERHTHIAREREISRSCRSGVVSIALGFLQVAEVWVSVGFWGCVYSPFCELKFIT
jgi:hypothetical protein